MLSSTRNNAIGWLFAGPAVLFFLVFGVYPLMAGIGLSFFEMKGPDLQYVGLSNFAAVFQEPALRAGVVNTALYVLITVPFIVVVPALIAALCHSLRKMGVFVAFAFYLPTLSTGAILSLVWRWIFATDGLVNGLLGAVGIKPVLWLASIPEAFLTVCIVLVSLNMGGNIILYLVAERNIPRVLYEMAELDGCNGRQVIRHVTLPGMAPTIGMVTILATVGMFQCFVAPYMMTGGGPLFSTTTVLIDLYNNAWSYGRIGVASAEGVILLLVTGAIGILQARYVWRAK